MSMRCLMTRTSRLAVSSYAQNLLGGDSARRSFGTALLPTLASSRRPAPGLFRRTSVLRLTTSSGEEPDDEKPEEPTPKNRSELEIVREKIVKAEATLAKYEAWFENEEKGVTAEDTREAKRALIQLRDEKARLEAPSAPSSSKFLEEGGDIKWGLMYERVKDGDVPRDAEALETFLRQDLPVKFPVCPRIKIPPDAADSFAFAEMRGLDDESVFLSFSMLMASSTIPPSDGGPSENANQQNTDLTFSVMLRHAFRKGSRFNLPRSFKRERNTATVNFGLDDNETVRNSKKFKPDFSFAIDDRSVFVGEEKTYEKDFGVAVEELCFKCKWNPNDVGERLPYIVGYACAGTKVQLFAILPHGFATPVTPPMNLEEAADRFFLARAMVNVVRILPALADRFAENALAFQATQNRPCGITIAFMGDYVDKRVNFDEENAKKFLNREHLERLYRDVLPPGHEIPNTICVVDVRFKDEKNEMELSLSPFGEHVERTGQRLELAVARPALRDVLCSLQALHAKGWCHRDVRWPNIMQRREDGSCMLIDFENAAPIGERVTWPGVDSCHPPETRLDRGELQVGWEPKHDLWQVANLALQLDTTEQALDFINKVISGEIDSAEAALEHPFFAAEESS